MENIMLIVDDVEMNREILKMLFHEKYEILEAENGQEALDILEGCQGNIDIILLDLLMPGLDGFGVLEKRKRSDLFNHVPVVLITSSADMQNQIKAFDIGANDFINKPFVPEIVVSRVNNVMASHQRMQSIEQEAQKLKIKSELDEMTGIYNKTTIEYIINDLLKNAQNRLNVMMVIDIDNFKAVNDNSGHQVGDHVIKIIADLISSMFRKTDVVGRIGGDEFIAMMVDIPSMDIAYTKINELIQLMRYKPNLTIPEYVTLSIGVASNHRRDCTYQELFLQADSALYDAKTEGKARFQEYGVNPIDVEEDSRPTVLLLSNNRNICSTINAMMPQPYRVVEALDRKELERIGSKVLGQMEAIYVDVSEAEDNGDTIWKSLTSMEEVDFKRMVAICQEGNVSQYMLALQQGIGDMITAPLEAESLKRRLQKQLNRTSL